MLGSTRVLNLSGGYYEWREGLEDTSKSVKMTFNLS